MRRVIDRDEGELISYVRGRPGTTALALREVGDAAAALGALRSAAAALRRMPHPDVPADSLVSWASALPGDAGPVLHIDMQDHFAYARRVVHAVLDALDAAGLDGRLEPVHPPVPPFEYDADADIVTGATFLEALDRRGLPPAFPDGFPVPGGAVLVIAQRARDGTWEHAAWRRDRPFADFPESLGRFGCELEPAEAADLLVRATGMTRHLFRHPAGTGSVSTYHEYEPPAGPSRWYVSVVWRPAS